jgi:hypothetical protein
MRVEQPLESRPVHGQHKDRFLQWLQGYYSGDTQPAAPNSD